jgi:hypothetical protein
LDYKELHQAWLRLSPETQKAVLDGVQFMDFNNEMLVDALLSMLSESGFDTEQNRLLLSMIYYENHD